MHVAVPEMCRFRNAFIDHPGPGAGDPDQVETGLIFVQEVFALQGWPGSAGAFEPPHAGIDRLARHSPHDGGKSRRPSVGG